MKKRAWPAAALLLATAAMVGVPAVAAAQSEGDGSPPPQYESPPSPQYQSPPAPLHQALPPSQGQYAAPSTATDPAEYNNQLYQQALNDYHARYAQWAAHAQTWHATQDCVAQHNSNVAAGAIFGGVAGALLAAGIAGWAAAGAWTLFGGSVGLTAGALIGSSATNCGPGYAYGGPGYYGSAYGPPAYAPYHPWAGPVGPRYYRPYPYYYRRPVYPGYGYPPPPNPYYRY